MAVARVVVGLTLVLSAVTGLDADLRAEDTSSSRGLILAHIVSGSEGGLADGIYACGNSVAHSVTTCAHLRKPLLRLERHESRRTIFDGANPVYQATVDQTGDYDGIREEGEEGWVWLHAASKPTPDASPLTVRTVRDTGCFDDERESNSSENNGKGTVFGQRDTLEMQQLGDVYHRVGRLSEASVCYTGALRAGQPPPDRQHRCHLRLALCAVRAAEGARNARTRGGGGGNQLSSSREQQQREETDCFAGLLLDEEEGCSEAVGGIVGDAHLAIGVFRLCEEWDVGGALRHFSMATANTRRKGGPVQDEEEDRRALQGGEVGWGAVWLAQAIQGRAYEASAGFTAKAAAFGDIWATTHLQNWRRRLGRGCSGIGMGSVVEGAERLIVAGAWTATMQRDGVDGVGSGLATQATIADLHLTLARTLLHLGASGEADAHARAVERLSTTRNSTATTGHSIRGEKRVGSGNGGKLGQDHDGATADATALRLEVELLSRTPVVLEMVESAASLRKSLLAVLNDLTKTGAGLSGSIRSPFDVGLRAQFLATYQGLDDKAVASAFAVAFDRASSGALSYYSPHLLWEKDLGEDARLDGNHDDTAKSKWDGEREQEPSWPRRTTSTGTSTATATSQRHEGSKKAATSATCDEKNDKQVRVGFLSSHFRWHSVGRLTIGLLERLRSSCSLEMIVIDASIDGRSSTAGKSSPALLQDSSGEPGGGGDFIENPITKRLNTAGISIVRLPAAIAGAMAESSDPAGTSPALQNARKAVAALKLDVLVYADVGMDALTTSLAHGRLSPVQVAFWGHPGTTGLSTMDYFISSDLFEGELGTDWDRTRVRGHDRGSFFNANATGSGAKYLKDGIPIEVDAEDRVEAVDRGTTRPLPVTETRVRQDTFSEQLVRLGGLGIVFDDPIETFGWDPFCGNTNDLSLADSTSLSRSHDGREPIPGAREAREPRHPHTGDALKLARPLSPEGDGGVSPEEGRKKDATTSRPRQYVCAQSLMKMHPAFDAVLTGILAADPLAQILLLRDPRQLLWHSRFRRRLRAAIDAAEERQFESSAAETANATSGADGPLSSPFSRQPGDFWGRVRFLSPLSGREFFRLQCRADVVLDPFPFGGGVTTLEALACGTPVVTAGPLQTVHRLAEGMVVAAANANRQDAKEDHSPGNVDAAGGTTQLGSAGVADGTAPERKEGKIVPEEMVGEARSGDGHTTRRGRSDGGQSPGGEGVVTGHCFADANDDDDARVLVENLLARTTEEYVEKAVAVAAPGALKERVQRALCRGRDGMLRGDGDSVATEWERFLKIAAASA